MGVTIRSVPATCSVVTIMSVTMNGVTIRVTDAVKVVTLNSVHIMGVIIWGVTLRAVREACNHDGRSNHHERGGVEVTRFGLTHQG